MMDIRVHRPLTLPLSIDLIFELSMPVPHSGCWIWCNVLERTGYGMVSYKGRRIAAHRIAWILAKNQSLTAEQQVCHKCDVRCCVNPDHLFVGSQSDNMMDMIRKGRKRYPQGAAHPVAKISEDDARTIYASALPSRLLADQFGISPSSVQRIKRGINWRHLAKQGAA